jgi:DNA-binding NtrC family response regulator
MKNDMNDLKKLVLEMLKKGHTDEDIMENNAQLIQKLYSSSEPIVKRPAPRNMDIGNEMPQVIQDTEEIVEESLSLEGKEIELIRKALEKYHGKRKDAARELGISERTLYRKIKEHDLDL